MNKKENQLLERIWNLIQKNSDHIAVINEELGVVRTDVYWIKRLLFVILPILVGAMVTLWLRG